MKSAFFAVVVAAFLPLCASPVTLPVVPPESVGFSSERLGRFDRLLQAMIDRHEFAGIYTLTLRHGKIVHRRGYGRGDLSSARPMDADTIVRLHSMSKPITAVAMMALYEEGKWSPEEPVAAYIPEFSGLKVFRGLDATGQILVEDPNHAPTMRELMTHTAGFASGAGNTPVDRLCGPPFTAGSLHEMIERLARIPLLHQPGTCWVYGPSPEIEGYLIEKLSGQTIANFERERILQPLGMADTGFFVPRENRSRFAGYYVRNERGELAEAPVNALDSAYAEMPRRPSGGGGMVSTISDYVRFTLMLKNGGIGNGARILSPVTVRLMTANHLAPSLMVDPGGSWIHRMRPGFGSGFGVGVYTEPLLADEPMGKGTYCWGGTAGVWFWVDPEYDIISIGVSQRVPDAERPNLDSLSHQLIYQALVRPEL